MKSISHFLSGRNQSQRLHWLIQKHRYLLKLEEPPICESCNTPLTVEHIIIHCRKYLREKQQRNIKASQQNTLKEIKTTQNLLLTLSNALSIYKLNYKTEYKLNL